MKFIIDTKAKTVTLLERCSFTELGQIKAFIGLDLSGWSIISEKVKEIEYINWNNWGWKPWTSGIMFTQSQQTQINDIRYKGDASTSNINVSLKSEDKSFLLNSEFMPKGTVTSYTTN